MTVTYAHKIGVLPIGVKLEFEGKLSLASAGQLLVFESLLILLRFIQVDG